MNKKIVRILTGIAVFLILLILSFVTTIDRTPYQEMSYYKKWKQQVNRINELKSEQHGDSLLIGWAKTNLTPENAGPMAGYGQRRGKHYTAVHDSILVRTLFLKQADFNVAIVSADLLIIPPGVKKIVEEKKEGNINIYYGATHSHNSIGGWYNTLVGQLFAGEYNAETEQHIAASILKSINDSQKNLQEVKAIRFHKDLDDNDIKNRLNEGGITDYYIRSLSFETPAGKIGLITYAAHATVLNSATLELSRDYPGILVDSLENQGFIFATYLAGAVGSMAPIESGEDDFDEIKNQGGNVAAEVLSEDEFSAEINKNQLSFVQLELPLRKPSPRISLRFALRPWVFQWLFGNSSNYITGLKIGSVLMVGLPCDFSGELMPELDKYAETKGIELIVTSFNGGYTGYITADEHFEKDAYETITMNWFGPYNGSYFSEAVKDLINTF